MSEVWGIPWCRVPASWRLIRVGDACSIVNGYPFDSAHFSLLGGTPLIRIRDLSSGASETYYDGPDEPEALIHDGDVIIGMDGDFNIVQWNGGDGLLNQRLCALRPRKGFEIRFVKYALPIPLKIINDLTHSTTVKHLSSLDIAKITIPCPIREQQFAIAEFLDRESAKVDDLLANNEHLANLLGEHRFSTIHNLVTKGIVSTRLKDSGHEWIGAVPDHWGVVKTKFVARLATGHTPSRAHPEYWVNCNIPWFSLADVWQLRGERQEYLGETSEKISELGLANSAAVLLPAGTVIVSRTASVGFSGIMPVPMATTQDFVNWICGPRIMPEYLLYVFRSMRNEFQRLTMGSTHKTIYMPDVAEFVTPLPPIQEQESIVKIIREKTAALDHLEDVIVAQRDALAEHRSSLIFAAVTGQIDVRTYRPQEATALCQ